MLISGYRGRDRSQIILSPIDRLSPEGCILLFLIIGSVCVFAGRFVGFRLLHLVTSASSWYYVEKLLLYLIAYLVGLLCFFSLLRRYKARILWNSSWLKRGSAEVKEYFTHEASSRSCAYCYILFVGLNITFACTTVYLFFYLESTVYQLFLPWFFWPGLPWTWHAFALLLLRHCRKIRLTRPSPILHQEISATVLIWMNLAENKKLLPIILIISEKT